MLTDADFPLFCGWPYPGFSFCLSEGNKPEMGSQIKRNNFRRGLRLAPRHDLSEGTATRRVCKEVITTRINRVHLNKRQVKQLSALLPHQRRPQPWIRPFRKGNCWHLKWWRFLHKPKPALSQFCAMSRGSRELVLSSEWCWWLLEALNFPKTVLLSPKNRRDMGFVKFQAAN